MSATLTSQGVESSYASIRAASKARLVALGDNKDEESTVLALEAGADDYFVRTMGERELLARVNALLRRR